MLNFPETGEQFLSASLTISMLDGGVGRRHKTDKMRAFLKTPLFIAILAVLLCALTEARQVFDHVYWNVWYKNESRSASPDFVLVSLDGGNAVTGSVIESTARQADLIKKLESAGAHRILIDLPAAAGVDADGDRRLYNALAEGGSRITLVNRATADTTLYRSILRRARFVPPTGTPVAASAWDINFNGYARTSAPVIEQDGKLLPTVAVINNPAVWMEGPVYPDFSVDPDTVPVIDARDVIGGKAAATSFAGKTVFVSATNPSLETVMGYFGHARQPAALIDIAAIEGQARGPVKVLGGMPLLVLFIMMVLGGQRLHRRGLKIVNYSVLVLAVALIPGLLIAHGLVVSPDLALIAVLSYGPSRSLQKWRRSVELTSSASGLPNIEALASEGIAKSQDVVAASVSQYEQMLASLPREMHGECARQIARRLSLGAGDCAIFDNDNGHFVWLENSRTLDALVDHLEGLKALFSSPLVIGGHILDTNVHFGIDRNIDNKPMSRIQSALASANEAQAKSKLYEEFGQQRLAQSPWELSLHARIDEGLRNGDIWLALQPQYDMRHDRFSGAEALIRWSDPERGAIPPDAFILQAERAGRIEAITYWVLERSIAMSRALNEVARPFQISVNLSARMVDHPALLSRISDIVREHPIDCSLITFEVTETFSLTNREQAKRNLAGLRAMGFRLSIDDFGTGQASLAYLAEIPSDEIKLDRRFIQAITTNPRERLIVANMIGLSHALGQEVVAEGIEDEETLAALRELGCDLAQGYHIGRPMKFPDLAALLGAGSSSRKPESRRAG